MSHLVCYPAFPELNVAQGRSTVQRQRRLKSRGRAHGGRCAKRKNPRKNPGTNRLQRQPSLADRRPHVRSHLSGPRGEEVPIRPPKRTHRCLPSRPHLTVAERQARRLYLGAAHLPRVPIHLTFGQCERQKNRRRFRQINDLPLRRPCLSLT